MGSIVSGLLGGGKGGDYTAQSANVLQPATVQQATDQYGNVQTGIKNQADLLAALQAQNGLQNQSNVFNQLQGVANGTGPNPAQAMLANATGANTANQAALMASQRGAGANPALLARQAAMQGGANQQNAAGQAAQLQAQQSLGALGQMGGIAGQQAGQQLQGTQNYSNAANQAQQNILGAIGAQNNANVANVSNMNAANAGLQAANAKGQQNLAGNLMGGIGSGLQMLPGLSSGGGGAAPYVGSSSEDLSGVDWAGMAEGGAVPQSNVGTNLLQQSEDQSQKLLDKAPHAEPVPQGPQSSGIPGLDLLQALAKNQAISQIGSQLGDFFGGMGSAIGAAGPGIEAAGAEIAPYAAAVAANGGAVSNLPRSRVGKHFHGIMMAEGGKVPALVSPGERYLPPQAVKEVAKGKDPMKAGEKIPGKAKVKGAKNSYANDTVPKTLEEGGIVLPRSVTQAKHPHWAAHKFVAAVMKQNALKRK